MVFPEFQQLIAALCAWREARGENVSGDTSIGMRAVLHVINNRSKLSGASWSAEVYKRLQFTSMTYGSDPEISLVPSPDAYAVIGKEDSQFSTACDLAGHIYNGLDSDPTFGATHYFNPKVVLPLWAKDFVKVASIGNHDFYKAKQVHAFAEGAD